MPNCEINLFKDINVMSADRFSKYTYMKSLSSKSEEFARETLGVLYDSFKLDYNKSKSDIEAIDEYVNSSGLQKESQFYFNRYLSSEALKAYSLCVMESGNLPFSIWFENVGDDTITISMKVGNLMDLEGEITVLRGSNNDISKETFKLSRSSEKSFIFVYEKDFDVDVLVDCITKNGIRKSASLYLPKKVNVVIKRVPVGEKSVKMQINAGGQGGSSSAAPRFDPVSIVADPGFYVDEFSYRESAIEQFSPPMNNWKIKPVFMRNDAGNIQKIDFEVTQLDGSSGKTQSGAIITLTASQYKIVAEGPGSSNM